MTNGWPNPERPGVPANPERDGWHWVKDFDENIAPWRWCAADEFDPHGCWIKDASEDVPLSRAGRDCEYLGPCLTPSEVAALVEAARADAARAKALMRDFVSSLWMDGPGADDIVRADALAAMKEYLAGGKHE